MTRSITIEDHTESAYCSDCDMMPASDCSENEHDIEPSTPRYWALCTWCVDSNPGDEQRYVKTIEEAMEFVKLHWNKCVVIP